MANKLQKNFNKAMRKIARKDSRKKSKFYSFLERDMIKGYYAIKNPSRKLERIGIKVLQYVMCTLILVQGMGLVYAVTGLDLMITFLFLMSISLTLLFFGLIHPHIVWSPHRYVRRYRVFKLFGIPSGGFLLGFIISMLLGATHGSG